MEFPSSIPEVAVYGFAALCLAAAVSDSRRLIIPNHYCLAMALLYPVFVLSTDKPVHWLAGLGVGAGFLTLGFLLYTRKILGGGDAKLVAAVTLWAGTAQLAQFLLITGLAGGVMAFVLWIRHRFARAATPIMFFVTRADPNFAKQPMAYGVPVALGGLYVAFTLLV